MDKSNNLMNPSENLTLLIAGLLKEVFIAVDKSATQASNSGGCTVSVALQLGPKLFVANAGDSVTLVAAHRPHRGWNKTVEIVYASRKDQPDLPEERTRIEQAGGQVQIPKYAWEGSSRVIYKDPSGNDVGLAMSRSIGDWDAPGVTAEPIVDVLDLPTLAASVSATKNKFDCDNFDFVPSDVNFFVVSATDGLMDFSSKQDVANKIGVAIFGPPNSGYHLSGVGAHLAAEELVDNASRRQGS
jgi:serine/threonine protein phosphatase PrpC